MKATLTEIGGSILKTVTPPQQHVRMVVSNGSETDPFLVKTEVKEGSVVAPTLFSIFLAIILRLIADKLPSRLDIQHRMGGKLFSLNRLQSKTKTY